jgi:mono/diheme cytochrome c family protein
MRREPAPSIVRARRRGLATCAAWLAPLFVLSFGCGREERAVREWRPSDHAEPTPVEGQSAPTEPAGASGPGAAASPSDESPEARDARAVAELYGVICASCHGPGGDGDGPARPPGMVMPRFADPAWQASRTDEAIAQAIVAGRGQMPAFGQQVNPRGVAALVRHLRALGAASGTASPGAVPAPGGSPAVDAPPAAPPADG